MDPGGIRKLIDPSKQAMNPDSSMSYDPCTASERNPMQLQSLHASTARYGGYLEVTLPATHWAWSPGHEGDPQTDPRFVVTDHVLAKPFGSLADAVAAAQGVSDGARHAVAVVRNAQPDSASQWFVDELLVQPFDRHDRYHAIDLEGVAQRRTYQGATDVWQPLQSQRQVLVDAVVDGSLVLDRVGRYQSTRP
jgi:hypothetical protein